MLVDIQDCKWQRIFCRFDVHQPLQIWHLLTATYGTVPAPFIAKAYLLELARLVVHSHPLASELLRRHRYVDDFLAGEDTLEEAKQAQRELVEMLDSVGMAVDKCAANHRKLVSLNSQEESKELSEKDVVSTLGMRRSPSGDVFHFKVKLPLPSLATTKRSILSEISKLFDPVAFLAPVIIRAKVVLQCLWLQGVDCTYRQQLVDLESVRIVRWNGVTSSSGWHLHGFYDASERAFAAALYVVVPGSERAPRLLVAKSKVAPLKVVSLPKLELCGAVLLANLISGILSQLNSAPVEVNCWSDPKVVLAWLRSHPSRWKSYVANRVSGIVTLLPSASWRHVPSAENPADLTTRGCTPSQLKQSSICWSGSVWLRQNRDRWPMELSEGSTELEVRRRAEVWLAQEAHNWEEWFTRFSSFDKLVGTLAYCIRWRRNVSVVKRIS